MKVQLIPIVKRTPAYIKLGWAVAREPAIPWAHRAGLYATVVYILSPAHIAMNAIPVLGQVDWIVFLLLSIRQAVKHCPPGPLRAIYARIRLQPEQLQRDLDTLQALLRQTAGAANHALHTRLPDAGIRKKAVFAGRVVSGFTRRVAKRLQNDLNGYVASAS